MLPGAGAAAGCAAGIGSGSGGGAGSGWAVAAGGGGLEDLLPPFITQPASATLRNETSKKCFRIGRS
jgi:hypothetical protein